MNDNTQGSGENQQPEVQAAQPAAPAAPAAPANRKSSEKKQASQQPAATKAQPRVNIRNRHEATFRHDVFVSTEADGIRNVGYEHLKPMLTRHKHKHIYHSHNNQGRKLNRTGSMIGHWHEVEHYVDSEGNIRAKCGVPLHEVTYQDEETGLVYTRIEQVSFEELIKTGPNAGKRYKHVDDHTHELEYLGSEELNPRRITEQLKNEREEAAAHGIIIAPGAVKDTSPAPMSPADGVTLEVL